MNKTEKKFEPYHGIDVEEELAIILQEEIWKEITAETGETQQDLDNEIIAELSKLIADHTIDGEQDNESKRTY